MTSLTLVFAVLAVLVALTGLRKRREVKEGTERLDRPGLDDDVLRKIEAEGHPGSSFEGEDEPLDLEEAEREERRFWEESWDDPEEF